MRLVAPAQVVLLQVSNDPIDCVGLDASVDVARRRERHVMLVKDDLHGQGPDDDNIVSDWLQNRCSVPQQTGRGDNLTSSSHLGSRRRPRGRVRRRGGSRGRAGLGRRL